MNVEKVLNRVNEVRLFSDRLHEVHNPSGVGNSNAFRYYFSAFLNAAYSVEQFGKWEVTADLQAHGKIHPSSSVDGRNIKRAGNTLSPEEQELWCSLLGMAESEEQRYIENGAGPRLSKKLFLWKSFRSRRQLRQ